MGDPGDLVFTFSYVSWEGAEQRGWFATEDRLAAGLSANPRIGRLLVADQRRSLPVRMLRDAARAARRQRSSFPASASARLVRPVGLRREYPTSPAAVARACRRYDRALQRRARAMGMERPAVITANPLLAGFAPLRWAGPVTFLAIDDWLSYPPHRRWWPAYQESFRRLAELGRRVCAVSDGVLARVAPSGPSLVLPNGLDPGEWTGEAAPPPAWAAAAARPLLLYVGSLDERLDIGALRGLARAMPQATIALAGPVLEEAHIAPLRSHPNVRIEPPLGRAELSALVRSADAGLIAHASTPLTQAMSPLKLYEYLAAGIPVVATDLPPLRGVDARVELVAPGDELAGAVRRALDRGRAGEAERCAFIARNSWQARHEALLDLALA